MLDLATIAHCAISNALTMGVCVCVFVYVEFVLEACRNSTQKCGPDGVRTSYPVFLFRVQQVHEITLVKVYINRI